MKNFPSDRAHFAPRYHQHGLPADSLEAIRQRVFPSSSTWQADASVASSINKSLRWEIGGKLIITSNIYYHKIINILSSDYHAGGAKRVRHCFAGTSGQQRSLQPQSWGDGGTNMYLSPRHQPEGLCNFVESGRAWSLMTAHQTKIRLYDMYEDSILIDALNLNNLRHWW